MRQRHGGHATAATTTLVILILVSLICCTGGIRWEGCDRVALVWNKISGRPKVALNETHGSQLIISWRATQLVHGWRCAQAFTVEYRQSGGGWKGWTRHWSAAPACALLADASGSNYSCTRELTGIDCGKRFLFRVSAHNLFNLGRSVSESPAAEARIQCLSRGSRGKRIFKIRVPHALSFEEERRRRLRLQGPTWAGGKGGNGGAQSPRQRIRTTTTQPAKGTTTASTTTPPYPVSTTSSNFSPTTSARSRTTLTRITSTLAPTVVVTTINPGMTFAGEEYPPRPTTTTPTNPTTERDPHVTVGEESAKHLGPLILIPGNYSNLRKSYEVRHNLKDFESAPHELRFCYRYVAYDLTDSCSITGKIHPGMTPCLLTTAPLSASPAKRRFKMLLNSDCSGFVDFLRSLDADKCEHSCVEGATFIVA